MEQVVKVTMELSADQAWALAQLAKRLGWSDMRACAIDDVECYEIRGGVDSLQRALREAGFAPR